MTLACEVFGVPGFVNTLVVPTPLAQTQTKAVLSAYIYIYIYIYIYMHPNAIVYVRVAAFQVASMYIHT